MIADEPVMAVPTDVDGFCKAISKVLADEDYRKTLADKNQKAVQKFDKQNVISIMSQIYRQLVECMPKVSVIMGTYKGESTLDERFNLYVTRHLQIRNLLFVMIAQQINWCF